MPGLISFEWEKCPDGYTVEVFRLDYLQFKVERAVLESESNPGSWRLMAYPINSAPKWLHEILADPHDNPFADKKLFDSVDEGNSWIDPIRLGLGHPFSTVAEGGVQLIVPRSKRVIRFEPLKESGAAFMEYAECVESDVDVARFVSKYGCPRIVGESDDFSAYKETLFTLYRFQDQANEMRWAVDLWKEAVKTGDYSELQNNFNQNFPLDQGDSEFEDDISDWRPGRERLLATRRWPALVQLGVMLWSPQGQSGPPILSLTPHDLEAGLWLQYAQAISANALLQRCAVCPTWFAYGTGTGRRKSAHYCSDRCRKAAHRQRISNC